MEIGRGEREGGGRSTWLEEGFPWQPTSRCCSWGHSPAPGK